MYRNERDWVYETEWFPFQCFVSGLENGASDVASVALKLRHEDGSVFELTYPGDIVVGYFADGAVISVLLVEPVAAGTAGDMAYQLWVTSVQGTVRCVADGTLRIVATL